MLKCITKRIDSDQFFHFASLEREGSAQAFGPRLPIFALIIFQDFVLKEMDWSDYYEERLLQPPSISSWWSNDEDGGHSRHHGHHSHGGGGVS